MDGFDYDQGFDVEEFLERSQKAEEKQLEQALERIDEQLELRDEIHEDILEDFYSKLDWYRDRLIRLYKQKRGKSGERERLKSKIESYYYEILEEKRKWWQDREELERERRQILQSLDELDIEFVEDYLDSRLNI